MHVVPGTEHDNFGGGTGDTKIEIWAAHQGASSWTKIWSRSNYRIDFQDDLGNTNGWNSLQLSMYYEGATTSPQVSWYHRYTQVIVSQRQIALPSV
jgi:hypothetical protein